MWVVVDQHLDGHIVVMDDSADADRHHFDSAWAEGAVLSRTNSRCVDVVGAVAG